LVEHPLAALVVCQPGHPLKSADVEALVRQSLAGFKVPRRIRLVEHLPRLPNGKVDYGAATAMATADPP
jgi:non-ribosomal peptide synthetase component E (peptide arylation enzyme)